MGDQLYVDVWAPNPLKPAQGPGAKYERYWGDGPYQELLAACPTLVSCDDHEFWNDFPEPQIQVPYSLASLRAGQRGRAARALRRLPGVAQPGRQALEPFRRRSRSRSSSPTPARTAPATADPQPALCRRGAVAGPGEVGGRSSTARRARAPAAAAEGRAAARPTARSSTSSSPTGWRRSSSKRSAATPATKPHDILILTGDIHTGRISSAEIVGLPGRSTSSSPRPPRWSRRICRRWATSPRRRPTARRSTGASWIITGHRRLTSTVDNNVGLIKIARGRNGTYRFTLQLWRVRPFIGVARPVLRAQGLQGRATDPRPTRTRAPLRRTRCCGTPRANRTTEHVDVWTERYTDHDNAAFFADAIESLSEADGSATTGSR